LKKIILKEDIKLNFWDSAGDDVYFEIRNEFYKDTNCALLVYDISKKDTFAALDKWIKELQTYCKTHVHLFIIGNKADLVYRAVMEDEVKEYATKLGCRYFETSAKTGQGIQDVFAALIETCLA
jgi:DnaJ family protein C protein 27